MIIAVTNAKGGVGKTTLAVHLADWLFQYGYAVAFVDGDAQRLSYRWLRSASPELKRLNLTTPLEIQRELPKLAEKYDAVVVDAPGGLSEATGAILSEADAAFIPTGASQLDIKGLSWTVETIKAIQELREGLPQAIIIPVKAAAGRKMTRNLMARARTLGLGVTTRTIRDLDIYGQAAGLEYEGEKGSDTREPRLIWQMGKSKAVRDAALDIDAVFQEAFPEVCESDPHVIRRKVTPRTKLRQFEKEARG